MYYCYILQSQKDNSFYIGHTEDLVRRLSFHNEGMSKYTARKLPWALVYYEEYENRSSAMKREMFLKRQRNKSFYERLIKSFKK